MNHHESLEVHVDLDGETLFVGNAQFHRSRGALTSTTFQYDMTFMAHPLAYPVDPALQLVSGTQYTSGLPGAFADSAPDRWGRNLIKKRERAVARTESRRPQDLDDVDFLASVSDITRQGALRFRPDPSSPFVDAGHVVPILVQLPELLHAADVAARDDNDYEAVKTLLDAGTGSLGGARPKAAVLGDDGRQLIAKFPHPEDRWDVMAWEATALDLATAAGATTATHRLIKIAGRHLLLLDRFDRGSTPVGSPDTRRVGYMSTMTLLEQHDGDTGDYVDIAERLEEVSTRPRADLLQLFQRVAVNVGLNNTDDHLRNHGLLRGRTGWTLSPAFDVNPNPDQGVRQTLIAGADTAEDEGDGLLALARVCRLDAAQARATLTHIADALADWRAVASKNGVPASELTQFEQSFDTGINILRSTAAR
ncbi:type II toxin-antitoxin system HipA family toxin [Plantibacter sp. Mn2098]|uniref:type II toxin-antitoxin system HipA family toxin n=1 Tax=Plantibacter sp. Mn2098 TaxID=3395266 RepID=UPI003BE9E057